MATIRRLPPATGVDDVRKGLSELLRRIRASEAIEPVVFGSNRRAEAAIISVERLTELEQAEEQLEDLALAIVAFSRTDPPRIGTVAEFLVEAGLNPDDYDAAAE